MAPDPVPPTNATRPATTVKTPSPSEHPVIGSPSGNPEGNLDGPGAGNSLSRASIPLPGNKEKPLSRAQTILDDLKPDEVPESGNFFWFLCLLVPLFCISLWWLWPRDEPDVVRMTAAAKADPETRIDAITRRPITRAFLAADKEFRMGEVFRQRLQISEALKFYQDAVRLDPAHVEAQDRIGFCHWVLKQWPQAQTAFKQALAIDPNFFRSYFYLGRVFRKTANWKEATVSFVKAWELSGKREFLLGYEYAGHLFQLGMFPEAMKVLGELRSRFPTNPQAEVLLVKVQKEMAGK